MSKHAEFGGQPCPLGIANVSEKSEMIGLVIVAYLCAPLIPFLAPEDALDAAFVSGINTSVFLVLLISCPTQVVPSVVQWISVYVVNLVFGPYAVHVKPRKRPSGVFAAIYANNNSALRYGSGDFSDSNLFSWRQVCKNTGFRVVVKQFAEACCRERISSSHVALFQGGCVVIRAARRSSVWLSRLFCHYRESENRNR